MEVIPNNLPEETQSNITAIIDDFWQLLNILCDEPELLNEIGDYNANTFPEIYSLLTDLLHVKHSKRIRSIKKSLADRKQTLNLIYVSETNKHRINRTSNKGFTADLARKIAKT